MNIALFHDLPPGGAKRLVVDVVKRLSARHTIDLYTLIDRKETEGDFKTSCKNIYYFGKSQKTDRYKSLWERLTADWYALTGEYKVEKKIAERINQGSYEVAFVHPSRFTQTPYLLKYLKVPSVYYCHEPYRALYEAKLDDTAWLPLANRVYERILRKIKRRIEKTNILAATKILANSKYTASYIRRVFGRKAVVCYPGVDTKLFRPIRTGKKKMILAIGNIEPQKDYFFLLRSLRLLHKPPTLVIVGYNHRDRQMTESLAKKFALQVIIKTGVSDNDLVMLYNQAMITVGSAILEPFGLWVLESLSCGTAVVAVDEGGFSESIKDGEVGFLSKRNIETFAQKIELLLNNDHLRHKLSSNARVYIAANWTWEKRARKLERELSC